MTTTAYRDKTETALNTLTDAIDALETSDDWKRALDVAAKFHRYSFNNVMLIHQQAEDRGFTATKVAGYHKWRELDRQVRKGEKGLGILAPLMFKVEEDNGDTGHRLGGFKVVFVFDISQTDGEDLPDTSEYYVVPDGDAPDRQPLIEFATNLGYRYTEGPTNWPGAKGVTDFRAMTITVADGLTDAEHWEVLIHELGHAMLHGEGEDRPTHRGIGEVEAESVAYVVSSVLGVDTSGYSFAYIADWGGEADKSAAKVVADVGQRVMKAAQGILTAYERTT